VTVIGIALFDGAEELNWAGPWEVLAAWATQWPDDGVRVLTLAQVGRGEMREGPTRVAGRDLGERAAARRARLPRWVGTRAQLGDEELRGWLRGIAESGALVTSVCTGALVLADAGLLDGRPATSWWGRLDELPTLGRDIEVRPTRFVDSGEVVTAAGVSAGIDMALHLVARLHSPERAREVRRYIQYHPEPPV
jgi:transcriptional regulator GlxA family with amidase domain